MGGGGSERPINLSAPKPDVLKQIFMDSLEPLHVQLPVASLGFRRISLAYELLIDDGGRAMLLEAATGAKLQQSL